jgi:hypothetical protein
MYSNYDTWFTPKLIGDDVHTQSPEQLAEIVRQRPPSFDARRSRP